MDSVTEAVATWVDSYFYHWGHHAVGALKSIDDYDRENRGDEDDSDLKRLI